MSEKRFYISQIETHTIESRYVDQTYQVKVMQPLMKKGENERFPVLYVSEGNALFDAAKGISLALQGSEVRRFILVGIGYPGDHPFASALVRGRDFTPLRRPRIAGLSSVSRIEGVPGIEEGKKDWHGADDFLAFIRHELAPLIDKNSPTVREDRGYFGHSLGAGLGVHALFTQPDLFQRFILSSPGLVWDADEHGIEVARAFIASGRQLNACVFASVAEQEEFEPLLARTQFVSSFYRFAALLRKAQIPGFNFHHRIFQDETHSSVWPISFSHGIRAVYGPPQERLMQAPTWASTTPSQTKADV